MRETERLYACLTGHEIQFSRFNQDTWEVSMDSGATVRICSEHGTVVAEATKLVELSEKGCEDAR